MRRIVFWQEFPSIHQAPLIREIAELSDIPVYVVTAGDVSNRRLKQGWFRPDFEPAILEISPSGQRVAELLSDDDAGNLHVFYGIHAYPFVYSALRRAVYTRSMLGVISEPGRSYDWRGPLRLLRNRINAAMYSKHISFILATGQLGVDWYRRSGFPDSKVFPFAHFTSDWPTDGNEGQQRKFPVSLIYVGELAPHKGVDLLLEALAEIRDVDWRLVIIGIGAHVEKYRAMAMQFGLNDRIEWRGSVPNQDARAAISQADVLVLPSRHDGWGAVVNEALMVGVPVICSDACGASDLIQKDELGAVFKSGSAASLRECLKRVTSEGAIDETRRRSIRLWSQCISPRQGARYFLDIINFVRSGGKRPVAPWRRC